MAKATRSSARQANKKNLPQDQQTPAKRPPKKAEKSVKAEMEEKEEKEVPKSHPISKPKSYKSKSIDAKARINRSKTQRIFLMSASRVHDTWWNFGVEGVHC